MLLKVANDDVASYKNSNEWLMYHPNEAIIFKSLEKVWEELRIVYNGDFKNLVYGTLSDEANILVTLKRIKDRLSAIKWTIEIVKKV